MYNSAHGLGADVHFRYNSGFVSAVNLDMCIKFVGVSLLVMIWNFMHGTPCVLELSSLCIFYLSQYTYHVRMSTEMSGKGHRKWRLRQKTLWEKEVQALSCSSVFSNSVHGVSTTETCWVSIPSSVIESAKAEYIALSPSVTWQACPQDVHVQ